MQTIKASKSYLKKTKTKKNSQFFHNFLYILIILLLVLGFFIFRPFLLEIIIAAIISSVCFSFYERLAIFLGGRHKLSAIIICLALLFLIVVPISQLIIYAAKQAPAAFTSLNSILNTADILESDLLKKLNIPALTEDSLKKIISDLALWLNKWLIETATAMVINIGTFIFSLFIVLLSVFYFLLHGQEIQKKIIRYSPLPSVYSLEIIKAFREISRTTLLSLFVCALVQGILSAAGFAFIGWPFFIIFIISAFLSIIPYALGFFYLPIIAYLFATEQIWQGIFVIIWNFLIVINIDELIRAYINKGKTEINMAFMLFSILGGISLFGFWGIFIGPVVLAIAVSVLNIYGQDFSSQLKKEQ